LTEIAGGKMPGPAAGKFRPGLLAFGGMLGRGGGTRDGEVSAAVLGCRTTPSGPGCTGSRKCPSLYTKHNSTMSSIQTNSNVGSD